VDAVTPGFWPRAIFERIGLFDEELIDAQDEEFAVRLRESGGRSMFIPAMRSWQRNPRSVAELVRARYRRGQWMVRVLQKHPHRPSPRVCVLPALVAVALTLQLVLPFFPAAVVALRVLAWAYLIVVLIGAVAVSGRRGPVAVGAIALALVCEHVATGIGFWSGLVKYADRWRSPGSAAPRLTTALPSDPR
jgi:GT2 family glycosyltransferase